jgi:DNA-binding transcriptional LysR family regulator
VATKTRIHDLELVIALSEERTLSQAAKRVGMTQPAISKRLHVIERRLQLKLFEVNHRGADITESGRFFAEYAQQSVNLFHRGIHEARQARHAHLNRLRVGTSPFQPSHLVEMLRTVELRLYRNLSIEIESAFSCDLLRKLEHHEIDVALLTSPPSKPSITTAVLGVRNFMIVLHKSHELATQESVGLADVAAYPWVFFNRHVHPHLHDLILHRAHVLQLTPNVAHNIMHAEQVPAFLKDGLSVAWLSPTGAARVAHGDFLSRPLVDKEIRLETHLATLANNSSALVSEFVRTFMKRHQQERQPVQMVLPIANEEIEKAG